MNISKHNYHSMLIRAESANINIARKWLAHWFLQRMINNYAEQLEQLQATRKETGLSINDNDYAKLMTLASYDNWRC